jgi:hypothetical protein
MNEKIKKEKYPSQIKYEQNNPTITSRMKLYEKEKIDKMAKRAGKSVSMLIRMALLNQEKDFTNTINQAYNQGLNVGDSQGYERGKNDWQIQYPCDNCSKPAYLTPNSNCHKAIIDFLKANHWCHGECIKK